MDRDPPVSNEALGDIEWVQRRLAQAQLAQAKAKAKAKVDNQGPMLSSLVVTYTTERRAAGRFNQRSVGCFQTILLNFVDQVGDRPARKLGRRHLVRWVNLRGPQVAPSTLRGNMSAVRNWLEWMVERGTIKTNPMRGLRGPKEPRRLPRGLKVDDVAAVLQACPDARARLMVTLAVQQGLRCKEIALLDLGDIDLRERAMIVREGKGGHQRALPLTNATISAMQSYLAEQPARTGPLIRHQRAGTEHKPISAQHVSTIIAKVMHAAGVAESAHSLRHTAASDVLKGGAHLRDVQAMLGHASLRTTQAYIPLLVGDLREAMAGRDYLASEYQHGQT